VERAGVRIPPSARSFDPALAPVGILARFRQFFDK